MDEIDDQLRAMAAAGEAATSAYTPSGSYDYMNGALQTALALGTSYVSRRIDIDLQQRLAGMQPTARLPSDQTPINADLTTRAVSRAGGLRLGDLLPWAAIAGIGWLVLKRG